MNRMPTHIDKMDRPSISDQPSYEELLRSYRELQLRVTRFGAVEQELINARDRLDREVTLHKRMQDFNTVALRGLRDMDFIRLVAESMVDIFEFELAFACVSYPNSAEEPLCYLEASGMPDGADPQLGRKVQELLPQMPTGSVIHIGKESAAAFGEELGLNQAIATQVRDRSGRILITLLGGITEKGLQFYHPIDPKRDNAVSVFSQQVLAHVENQFKARSIAQSEKRLSRIADTFLKFGTEPLENINNLAELCGELMGADGVLYNRMDQGMLCSWAQWHMPADYVGRDDPQGHICTDVINAGSDDLHVIEDLPRSPYMQSDPNVSKYGLKCYIGRAVKLDGSAIGSLCALYTRDQQSRENDAHIMGIIAAAIAVEERRYQAIMALRESEERYRGVFEGSPQGIVVSCLEGGKFAFVNPAICNMLGYSTEELMDMRVEEIHPPESRGLVQADFEQMERHEMVKSRDIPCLRKDGSTFYADISANVVTLNGKPHVVGFITDVTLQKMAAEELFRNNSKLKKINSELDNFVYSISHDLRAPLLAVKGLINLIQNSNTTPADSAKYMGLINTSVNRMDETIKEILEYSRNARLDLSTEPINILEMVTDAFEDVKHYFPDNTKLITEIDDSTPFHSDKVRLNTVLKNLIGNAVKYKRHDRESWVKVRFSCDKENAHLEVEDNGEGIAPEHMDKIFKMFYRASSSTVGTGLGLYICREIVNNLGGEITARSEKGEGSQFAITIKNHAFDK